MRVSMKWLRELVDVDLSVSELVERLDLTGTAVEAVRTVGDQLDGIVVGRIRTKERHPDAEKLWVTSVDVGADEPLVIVCGAQNFEAGDLVPVALPGATLPNGMTIKKTKLRGVVSSGMNCSAAELGIGADESGLLILDADAPVGESFSAYRGMSDTVLELEVTPNRPDCLSMAGVAREVAAITGKSYRHPAGTPPEEGRPAAESVAIEIADPELCPRYTARLIRGVRIGPSPEWLAQKVAAAGARPINNVVDITNYVMFELGQPLHAFDAATLRGDEASAVRIIVRRAEKGETLRTLDGQDRELDTDTLLICDPTGPVALAGVMGGETTEVSESTADILLESASFSSTSTSRTSRSLALISEASTRFERGVDREGCVAAVDRAAQLMADLCGGTVAPGIVDVYPTPVSPRALSLRIGRLNALLGTSIPPQEVSRILTALGLEVTGDESELRVAVPAYRPDLEREIDLIEEVVRVWGMQRVESTLPGGRERTGRLTAEQRWRERIGSVMRAAGLNETMTYAFGDPEDAGRLGYELDGDEVAVELLNPMSGEQAHLRSTLAAGLLRAVSYNQRRGTRNVHLYEIGAAFAARAGKKLAAERMRVAGVLSGRWHDPAWHDSAPRPEDPLASSRGPELNFFDGKGVIESLVEDLGIGSWRIRAAEVAWLQPGRSGVVEVRGQRIGWVGEVHPEVLARFGAAPVTVMFELDLAPLIAAAVPVKPYTEIPRHPAVELDVALLVEESVTAEDVERAIGRSGAKHLASARLFDVYRGEGVPDGMKSLAYALAYRAADRTLTDEEVAAQHERLVRKVATAVGARMRE